MLDLLNNLPISIIFFFLKLMLDHSYFNATFFRSLFIYSIYQIPNAHERKITLSLHDSNCLCTIFAYYSS